MNAIRKMVNIRNNSLTIKGLKSLNNREVEVIIIPVAEGEDKTVQNRKALMKFRGAGASGYKDTSRNVDRLVYGR